MKYSTRLGLTFACFLASLAGAACDNRPAYLQEMDRQAGQIVGVLFLIPTWPLPIIVYYATFIGNLSNYTPRHHEAYFHLGGWIVCAVLPFFITLNRASEGQAWTGVLIQLVWAAAVFVAHLFYEYARRENATHRNDRRAQARESPRQDNVAGNTTRDRSFRGLDYPVANASRDNRGPTRGPPPPSNPPGAPNPGIRSTRGRS